MEVENERLQVSISTHGARPSVIRLKEYQTHSKTPLILADPDSGVYEFKFFAKDVGWIPERFQELHATWLPQGQPTSEFVQRMRRITGADSPR